MKAAVYYHNGDPEVLRYEDIPEPVLESNDVMIAVEAISLEGGDILTRRRVPVATPPRVVGYAAAGVVRAVGSDVTNIHIGDRVAAFHWSGSHAELWAVPERYVYPIPDGMDARLAATVPVAFATADDALFEFGRLHSGESVLIRGATGGVGLAAAQLAKAAGGFVIGTASSDERAAELKALGVDHTLNYRTQDVVSAVLDITAAQGVDLLVDMAGEPDINALTEAVRYRGRVSIVGAASEKPTSIGFYELVSRSLSVFGVSAGQEMHLARMHSMLRRHLRSAAAGTLTMPIERTYPLAEAAAAHRHVEFDHPFGRVVMVPNS